MAERESSVASSVDFYEAEQPQPSTLAADARHDTSHHTKRKAEEPASVQESKKLKVDPSTAAAWRLHSCARLPPPVWQHVFSFCSLAELGRLIQVNRSFLSYLTDVPGASASHADTGRLHLLKSESLWASARNALSSKPPKPLPGCTELQMWQLAWNKRCQFCSKQGRPLPGDHHHPWQKGPGEAGVRTIWPFAVRACAPCLLQHCQTDASLLFSAASALRPALPFALLTSDTHYVPAATLHSVTIPAHIDLAKYYYRQHVADITADLQDALARGTAAAEEWAKGLEARGNARMKLAENWERWEVRHQLLQEHRDEKPALAATSPRPPPTSPPQRTRSPVIHAPTPAAPSSQHAQGRPPTVPPQTFTPQPPGSTAPGGQRNLHDANEAKASRRSDIERRCKQLDPPIPPNILRHMESFRAAIQISQPMTDYAWDMLQPRLLAQLPAAQQAEADHVSRAAALPARATERRHPDANSKEAKDVLDREWEESQRPIRDKLNHVADDFIKAEWDHGNAVTYDNTPKFAADLLAHVRRTYYADVEAVQRDADVIPRADHKPALVLDNMKWVYDNKVKPVTEQYRKEIFLCHGSGCETNTRFYGFEGVIQHFGAKHTSSFSAGNVVVAWREAEWPEDPPFHPDPTAVKHHHVSSGMGGYGAWSSGFARAGTSTPHMQPYLPQTSPGPYGYAGQYNGPFAPPQTPMSGYGYPQPYPPPGEAYGSQAMGPPMYGAQPGQQPYLPSPVVISSALAPLPNMPLTSQGGPDPGYHNGADAEHSTSSFDKQVSTVISMTQDIWKQTSGIKDMPNSLRIYVLLHRVISKFHVEFNHEPNLNHFIDALSNHDMPKALKNAPGLCCKACHIETQNQSGGAYYSKSEERKTYTVLNLLTHFRSQHLSYQPPAPGRGQIPNPLDWKEDMIELPNERFISGLIYAPGMDDEKLLMIATVFPKYFPMPLPKIGVIDNHGIASPASSGPKDVAESAVIAETTADKLEKAVATSSKEPSLPPKPIDDDFQVSPSTLRAETNEQSRSSNKAREYDDVASAERQRHYYAEPGYYHVEEAYRRPRKYFEYDTSPRIMPAGPAYDQYTGRRTVFRGQERLYGPPAEQYVYTHQRDGSHGSREYSSFPRQVRYYGENEIEPEYQYTDEPQSRDISPSYGQSAADRFLENFTPGQASANGQAHQAPSQPDSKPMASTQDADEEARRTPPPPPAVSRANEPEARIPPLAPPHPRAPSTVSNGSRYDEYRQNDRQNPHDLNTPAQRPGPQRRRDRPQGQRLPANRYYRYMSAAREENGRGSSMSRAQSRRYEEQRRQINQQDTPQPSAEHDYDPAYSREPTIEHPGPDEAMHSQVRRPQREYVSHQDRYHPYSPPCFRYDEPRGPPVYVDEYGHPVREYEVVRVGGYPRPSNGPYMARPPQRYEPEPYTYGPSYAYEPRPAPQRHNSRPEPYMYYEERERPHLRRPMPETEPEPFEPLPLPEIKVESQSVGMPEGP
ncbi:hypothetical protein ACN47E_010253 [Coniothyrium glycines]